MTTPLTPEERKHHFLRLADAFGRIASVLRSVEDGMVFPSKHLVPCLSELALIIAAANEAGCLQTDMQLLVAVHYTTGIIIGVEAALGIDPPGFDGRPSTPTSGEVTPILGLRVPPTDLRNN